MAAPSQWVPGRRWASAAVPGAPQGAETLSSGRIAQIMQQDFVDPGVYTRDRIFLDFGHPTSNVGWKLHVIKPPNLGRSISESHLPDNYMRLLRYLRVKQIPHKIVANLNGLAVMERNSGQVGKFITIYPNDSEQLRRVADIIEAFVPDNVNIAANPLAPEDLPVGARGLIGARWGGLTSEFSVNQTGNVIPDDRAAGPRPDWVRNPFNPRSVGVDGWVQFNDQQKAEIAVLRNRRRR
jgi:hypothetical protein